VRKAEFDAVYRTGKRRSSSHFTAFFRANEQPQSRFGFSIKKTLGGAVVRNRIRRRPKTTIVGAPFAPLTADLLRLLKNM
jgi:ribonuclease P protein component